MTAVLNDEKTTAKAATWFRIIMLIYLLFYIVWIVIIGSYWVFSSTNADEYNSTLYRETRAVLTTVYVVLAVVILLRLHGYLYR